MPLTKSGQKVLRSMEKQYGGKKGKQVFYASINQGTIKGAEQRGGSHRKAPMERFR